MSDTEAQVPGETVDLGGRKMQCLICGYDRFWRRQAQLNTAAATFFDFDWANTSGSCIICYRCGYIHWFYPME